MATTATIASICGIERASVWKPGIATPLAAAGNVVANGTVGLGAPETVTVAADGFVVTVLLGELPIENFGDTPNMFPEVEFRKSR